MVYVIQVCRQLVSRSICSCSQAVCKPVWHIPLLCVQWKNSWWCTEELFETCRVSFQNKFEKLVHLVDFIIRNLSRCTVTWTSKSWKSHRRAKQHRRVYFSYVIKLKQQAVCPSDTLPAASENNVNPGPAKFVEYFVTKIWKIYGEKALSGGTLNAGRIRVTRKVTSCFENKGICKYM